jgi:AraC family transcriptional regulator
MARKTSTRIGDGEPAVVLEEIQRHFPALDVTFRGDDIRKPTDWQIHDPRHSIVVHLGGHMDCLETELDGFGGSTGGALPGEIWTIPAERNYASHACGKSIRYAVLRLRPNARDIVHGASDGRLDIKPVAGVRDDFLHHAVRQLIAAMRCGDDVSDMLAQSLSQSISLHILRSLAPGGPLKGMGKETGPVLSPRIARRLREYISDRIDERISLEELAKLADITTHQFLIAFRKAFASTPGQYIIQQRIRHAQRLLLNTRKDITTIALESGFSSHSHLTSSFTKQSGCSPSVFRASARQFQIPIYEK